MKRSFATILGILTLSFLVWGAIGLTTKSSTVTIKGTSNVHDWQSVSTEANVRGSVELENKALKRIKSMSMSLPVKSILSEKGSIMDNKTWTALKYKKHPKIKFTLTKVKSLVKKGEVYHIKGVGKLTIAGVTKIVNMNGTAKPLGNNKFKFNGSKKLKMTDYGIEPPTAFFGAMTTGDDITITFNITLGEPST